MSSRPETARPEAMRSAAGNVGGLVMQASGALLSTGQPAADSGSFGLIGSCVRSADAELTSHQMSALHSVLSQLLTVSSGVQRSADGIQEAAGEVTRHGGHAAGTGGPLSWSSLASAAVASRAEHDVGAQDVPTPHRAESIIGYLTGHGAGAHSEGGPFRIAARSAGYLAEWLASSLENQARLGVIGVYAGPARGLDGTPGGLRPGDVVCIAPGPDAADQDVTVGVVGEDDGLHNRGLLSPDFGGCADVQVYRPISGRTRKGSAPGPDHVGDGARDV